MADPSKKIFTISAYPLSYSGSYFTEDRIKDMGIAIHVLCFFALLLIAASETVPNLHIMLWFSWNLLFVWIMMSPIMGVVYATHDDIQHQQRYIPAPFREYRITPISQKEAQVDMITKLILSIGFSISSLIFVIFTCITLFGEGCETNKNTECSNNTAAYVFSAIFAGGVCLSALWIAYRIIYFWNSSLVSEMSHHDIVKKSTVML